jgi:hypothetical protein
MPRSPAEIAAKTLAELDAELVRYRPQMEAFLTRQGVSELSEEDQAFVRGLNDSELQIFCFIPMLDEKIQKAKRLIEDCHAAQDDLLAHRTGKMLKSFFELQDTAKGIMYEDWPEELARFRFLGDTSLYHF